MGSDHNKKSTKPKSIKSSDLPDQHFLNILVARVQFSSCTTWVLGSKGSTRIPGDSPYHMYMFQASIHVY